MIKKLSIITVFSICTVVFSSCTTLSSLFEKNKPRITLSRKIMAPGQITAKELADYFLSVRKEEDRNRIEELAKYYVYEGLAEGVNYSLAFAQMCLETGYLQFGNLVTPQMHNYCGLGSMDNEHPGESFGTVQEGVRAHIQHLQAYGTTEDQKLNQPLIDPRYSWVHKTKYIQDVSGLRGTWAMDPEYAVKIETILCKIEAFIN